MKTLTYTFLALAVLGMLTGHAGVGLIALVWAAACRYYDKECTVVDAEYEIVQAVSTVLYAQTSDSQ